MMLRKMGKGFSGESFNGGGIALSLKDTIDLHVRSMRMKQDVTVLDPAGVGETWYNDVTIQPDAMGQSLRVYRIVVDAIPDCIGVAGVVGSVNFPSFGQPGTSDFTLKREWINNNIVPPETLVLATWGKPIQIRFSNVTNYPQSVTVTTYSGIIPVEELREIMQAYQDLDI